MCFHVCRPVTVSLHPGRTIPELVEPQFKQVTLLLITAYSRKLPSTPEKDVKKDGQDNAQHNTGHHRKKDGEIALLDEDISRHRPGRATPGQKIGDSTEEQQYDASG